MNDTLNEINAEIDAIIKADNELINKRLELEKKKTREFEQLTQEKTEYLQDLYMSCDVLETELDSNKVKIALLMCKKRELEKEQAEQLKKDIFLKKIIRK